MKRLMMLAVAGMMALLLGACSENPKAPEVKPEAAMDQAEQQPATTTTVEENSTTTDTTTAPAPAADESAPATTPAQ